MKSRFSLTGSQVDLLPETDDDAKEAKLIRLLHNSKSAHRIQPFPLGRTNKTVVDKPEPLIKNNDPPTSKRKSGDNSAFALTKRRVTSHWLEKRSNAFGAPEVASDVSAAHESLSRALQAGCLRKIQAKGDENPGIEKKSTEGANSDLVAYDDSE